MVGKQKLELTWIGKENRPRLEPRILLEDPEKSYHAPHRVSENDIFDNRLIFGDNLLALKALEQEFTGRIKCIYIDPPYNTGSAFEHYDDGLEHSLWLAMMRDRLEILRRLLKEDGSIWINLDDNEGHYCKVLCDEVFGRGNFRASITWQRKYSVSNNFKGIASICDHILVYAKSPSFQNSLLARSDESAQRYGNPDNDPRGPWKAVDYLNQATPAQRPNLCYDITNPNTGEVITNTKKAWKYDPNTHSEHVKEKRIWWGINGTNSVPAVKLFLSEVRDGMTPHNWWSHNEVGHTDEAKKESIALFGANNVFGTPKPERLLSRVLQLATDPGDIVLDSFSGSGTTGAVAHKLGRKWIMIELGEHCHSHIIPRMKRLIDGKDRGGISSVRRIVWEAKITLTRLRDAEELLTELANAESENEGKYASLERTVEDGHLRLYGVESSEERTFGGGFRYYTLAPSLLEQDEFGNWIINKKFNPEMLAEAMCKLEGFRYAPSDEFYWQHGQSNDGDFIYVTTQTLSREQIQKLSDEVGDKRSLLICCGAYRIRNLDDFPNLTLKKIPRAVMDKCEWGKDDYSLEIKALLPAPNIGTAAGNAKGEDVLKNLRKARKAKDSKQPTLFAVEEAE